MNVLLVFLLLGASSQDATEDRWDVNAAYGPTSPLDFETTEGTWMNLDVSPDGTQIVSEQRWPLVANLAYGVTTSHDPSNDTEMVFTNSEMIRAGRKLGPRLFSTGTILYGAETPFKAVIESYDDALRHLRRQKAAGAFTVKSYNQERRDVRQMIIKAARELQMMVVPEGGSLLYMDETFVYDGHTGLEHSLPVPVLYDDVVNLFARSQTGYTPTLIVGYGGLSGEYYWYQHDEVWANEQLLQFMPREILGLDEELGSIEAGKLADLVVLGKNPLENIRNSDSVFQVMVNGRLYDAATMNEIGNDPHERKPFYWQRESATSDRP